jgi:DNA polymerase-3 subunit delta
MAKGKTEALTYDEVEASFRKKNFSPLYLFHGEEDFLVEETVQTFINHAVDESTKNFNLDIVYGSETDAKSVAALASSFPMMGERRVVIVREFDKLTNKDPLIPYIEHPSPSTSLLFISPKPDFRVKVFKLLKEKSTVVEFKQLYDNAVPNWINHRVEKLGKHISPEASQLMQSYVGRSLREIENEIKKLFIYIGEKGTIDVDDVHTIVGMSKQYNIFEMQQALGAKNLSRALEIVHHMLGVGESAIGIIVMLTRFYQKLWLIQDGLARKVSKEEIAGMLRLSPKQMYFLDAEIQSARRYSPEQLENCFIALLEADERMKTSQGSDTLIMTLLIHSLLREKQVASVA